MSDAGVLRGAGDYPPPQGTPVTATGSGTLAMAPGDTSGALIEAQPAAHALSVTIPTPPVGTEMLGEPTLSLSYSGTAANSDGRVYAQIVDNQSNLVLGNQVTPIPVTLDGSAHTLTIPLEAVAADVTGGKSYTLQLTDGTSVYFAARQPSVVNLSSIQLSIPTVAAGAGQPVAAPPVRACPTATGRLSGRSLGLLRLGMSRGSARHVLRFASTRGRRFMDFFCLSPNGIRAGYPSAKLLRSLSRHARRGLRGHVVLLLSANPRYGFGGIHPGTRVAHVTRRLRAAHHYRIGLNTWYVVPRRGANGILKVRHGRVQEVGIASRPLTTGRGAQHRFLKSFY